MSDNKPSTFTHLRSSFPRLITVPPLSPHKESRLVWRIQENKNKQERYHFHHNVWTSLFVVAIGDEITVEKALASGKS